MPIYPEFDRTESLLVLNDIRLVDEERPDPGGNAAVCQIDHLVLHRWGSFIVESKSVTDEVSVRDDGTGGDEWIRRFGGRETGFPSPIQQARRQAEFLRDLLQRHRERLLARQPTGLRTIAKLVSGSDQRGFRIMPIQIIVAISDGGRITRAGNWREPSKPFQTFVSKADLVPEKIKAEFAKHQRGGSLLGTTQGEYGIWSMKQEEVAAVAAFLLERHSPSRPSRSETLGQAQAARSAVATPPVAPPPVVRHASSADARPPAPRIPPVCKACGASTLEGMPGRYGAYWKCGACGANTAMPKTCALCGAGEQGGAKVRVRMEGPRFFRACGDCGIEECIWVNAGP